MAILERDQGQRQLTPEEMASQQIEGYLERTEKQSEIGSDMTGVVTRVPQAVQPTVIMDSQGQVVAQAVSEEPEIDLPLTQSQVEDGLHHKLFDSLRWMAEFCVMIIKKYPGRVFYRREGQ